MRTAQFSSLKVLGRWEKYKSVKAGYKLTQKVLARALIKLQSVGLIMEVVNANTVTGLRLLLITTGKEEHRDTETCRAVFKRPYLSMAHMASFRMSLWDSLMCRKHKSTCWSSWRSLFICFGTNFSKDVSSEARKNKALEWLTGRTGKGAESRRVERRWRGIGTCTSREADQKMQGIERGYVIVERRGSHPGKPTSIICTA
ncbi:uncharacterized protein LOC130924468 [Corythoichthys intestinalis]|uniref:uncharacterized protein LOC130924468 n=1 Tax=Corythoichthys intestinalis TaxID=161448 RepID=UPI0025A51D13|nr:uncharacterized protein LOC130924468 [Corythoichthys intestinalis]